MKVDQKIPLRGKQLREQQKQAWIEHEEERKRKYMEFVQKKKQGADGGRYNEAISAKSKFQKELEASQAAKKHGSTKSEMKKPVSANQPEPRQRRDNESSAQGSRVGPVFNGNFVTLTKEQLKLLLDAAEGAKNKSAVAHTDDAPPGYVNTKPSSGYGEPKRQVTAGEGRVIAVTADPEQIPGLDGLSQRSTQRAAVDHPLQPAASLGDRKRQQWAEEKEELAEFLREAAAAAVKKAMSKNNEIPMPGDHHAAAAVVSQMLSESLREKKLRQWEADNKQAHEAKGSLAEIGHGLDDRSQRDRTVRKAEPENNASNLQSERSEQPTDRRSLIEKKKKQWEMEKGVPKEADIVSDWFGKGGAGAPIRSEAGDVLAQYGARASDVRSLQDTLAKTHGLNVVPKKQQQQVPVIAPDFHAIMAMAKESARGVVINEPGKVQNGEVPPAAMRSAFSVGGGGSAPDERRFESVKERERQTWLADLRHQIEEKQAQKVKERQQLDAYYREDPVVQSHRDGHQEKGPIVSKPSEKHIVQVEYEKKRQTEQDLKKEAGDNADKLRRALQKAEIEAQRSKLLRRIEKLRAGGHDTRGLEKTYKDLLTPRGGADIPSIAVGGLVPSDGYDEAPHPVQHQATRILTPTERRSNRHPAEIPAHHIDPDSSTGRESCAVQTEDFVFASGKSLRDILREQTKVEIEYRENKANGSHPTANPKKMFTKKDEQAPPARGQSKSGQPTKKFVDEKKPEPRTVRGEKKPWSYQNTKNRPVIKQSEREVAIATAERNERERRRKERAQQLINLAEVNMAKSRLLPGDGNHGRLVPTDDRRARSRSTQRVPAASNNANGLAVRGVKQRHVSPPPDVMPSGRQQQQAGRGGGGGVPPPRQVRGEAEFLPYRRTSGGLERGELPPNYDAMIDTSNASVDGAQKGELMRQHLQFLKQGLLRRQQELERSMTPNTLSEVRLSQQYRQT